MECQNCKHWMFGYCKPLDVAMGKESLCNAWELSLSWEQVAETPPATGNTAELQERIAKLERRIAKAKALLEVEIVEWGAVENFYLPDHFLQLEQVLDVLDGGGE